MNDGASASKKKSVSKTSGSKKKPTSKRPASNRTKSTRTRAAGKASTKKTTGARDRYAKAIRAFVTEADRDSNETAHVMEDRIYQRFVRDVAGGKLTAKGDQGHRVLDPCVRRQTQVHPMVRLSKEASSAPLFWQHLEIRF